MTSSLPLKARAIERCSSARRVLAAVVADCNSLALLLQKVCNKEHDLRATSSVVRALPSHGRGPRFKSLVAHHFRCERNGVRAWVSWQNEKQVPAPAPKTF